MDCGTVWSVKCVGLEVQRSRVRSVESSCSSEAPSHRETIYNSVKAEHGVSFSRYFLSFLERKGSEHSTTFPFQLSTGECVV